MSTRSIGRAMRRVSSYAPGVALAGLVATGSCARNRTGIAFGQSSPPGGLASRSGDETAIAYTSDSLYVESSGEGPPIVFVHAFSMDRRMWDGEVAALESSFRVIRYDQPGYGRSPASRKPFRSVDQLRAVLDRAHVSRATIVGLSSGALIAADFALAFPDRVTGLVLASPGLSGYVPTTQPSWMQAVVDAMSTGDAERTARAWAATPLMHVESTKGSAAILRMAVDNAGVWRSDRSLEQPPERAAVGRLGELHIPVLVLVGDADVSDAGRVAAMITAAVPRARRVTLASAGHMINLATPDAFDVALQGFLTAR